MFGERDGSEKLAGACALALLLLSCGGSSSASRADGGGESIAVLTPLEVGTCGIVRTLSLPPAIPYWEASVTRQRDGFAVGPWKIDTALRVALIDEHARLSFFDARGTTNDVSWPLFLARNELAIEVFVASSSPEDDSFDSRAWANEDPTAQARGNVLSATWRGTDEVSLLPALDGESGVFAILPLGLSEPRAAVIGANGSRSGPAHSFATPDSLNRCLSVTPNAHGAFLSFVDSNHDWRLFALEADGSISLDARWPMPSAGQGCPLLALRGPAGLAFLLDRAAAAEPPDRGLYLVDASGAVTESPLPIAARAIQLALLGEEPLLLALSDSGYELSRPQRGDSFPLNLPPGLPVPVASEAGSMWLDVGGFDSGRALVELSCK